MMTDPKSFKKYNKTKTYQELLLVRDDLLAYIKQFENPETRKKLKWNQFPSPQTIYQMYFQYLSIVSLLLAEAYNREFVSKA